MHHFGRLTGKKQSSSASAERLKREQNSYIKHGSGVLEELLALCDGKCRIPIRYFSAIEIERATECSDDKKICFPYGSYMVKGLLDKRLVFVRYITFCRSNIYRDIAITCEMSHLKNVLRLVGCCLEFEEPVMVYEYVEAITLDKLLFNKDNHDQTRKSLLSWGSRLRIATDVASAVVFLHTEFPTPIIHTDIMPSRVIIDQNSGVAKIVDFSMSISLPPGELEVEDMICGLMGYLDPDYFNSSIVTQKIDVYGFGIVLLQLLTAKQVMLVDGKMRDCEQWNMESNTDGCNMMDMVDPTILEEHGIENIQQQLDDYFDLVKKCTASKGEDRPYMIYVAKELRRIDKCFRSLTLGQS